MGVRILVGGLRISELHFLKKNINFFQRVYFFSVFGPLRIRNTDIRCPSYTPPPPPPHPSSSRVSYAHSSLSAWPISPYPPFTSRFVFSAIYFLMTRPVFLYFSTEKRASTFYPARRIRKDRNQLAPRMRVCVEKNAGCGSGIIGLYVPYYTCRYPAILFKSLLFRFLLFPSFSRKKAFKFIPF
jgi:hypothetical protein